MHRIPIPLLIAAVVAIGAAIYLLIQVTVLVPPTTNVMLLFKEPNQTVYYRFQFIQGGKATVVYPLGWGRYALTPNTTGWYYMTLATALPFIFAVQQPFTGVVKYEFTLGNTRYYYYLCNMSNYGGIFYWDTLYYGMVGDWVKVGSFYVFNPRNVTDPGYITCAQYMAKNYAAGWVYVAEPRADYYGLDSSGNLVVYFDLVRDTGYIEPKDTSYSYYGWRELQPGTTTVVGQSYIITSDYMYVIYPVWVVVKYVGNATTSLKVEAVK
ncbi:MAG: hypothetical protein ACP5H5_07675 [Pyrobaculum sp.]